MNKRQKSTKIMAKRAKAKQNKIKCGSNPNFRKKPKYISKAERAKMEAEQQATEQVAQTEENQSKQD
ncbi:MAG: DUF2986 domain-containing protein [Parashewanella sp.]